MPGLGGGTCHLLWGCGPLSLNFKLGQDKARRLSSCEVTEKEAKEDGVGQGGERGNLPCNLSYSLFVVQE